MKEREREEKRVIDRDRYINLNRIVISSIMMSR